MPLRDFCYRAAGFFRGFALARDDARQNRRLALAEERFLVVRHAGKRPHFYNVLLDWLEEFHPQVRARFELRQLNQPVRDWSPYVLHVPWLQDPVQAWSPTAYRQANQLGAACQSRGIPVINPVDRLAHAGKASGASLIGATGIRTPRIVRITDWRLFCQTRAGLELPLIVREDWRHGGPICRADSPAELGRIPKRRFVRPIAVEFIDVRSSDGLCRKYRYTAAGDVGVAQSLHPCKSWCAKGSHAEFNEKLRDEELAFIGEPDPNHMRLQAARRALQLDFVAFDYSYTHDGRLVVWEANPYPAIQFGTEHRRYRWPAVRRVLAAMARLYLVRAGLDVPPELDGELELCRHATSARAA
jgi:hypothetical protein